MKANTIFTLYKYTNNLYNQYMLCWWDKKKVFTYLVHFFTVALSTIATISTGCSMTSILLLGVGRAVDSPSDKGSLLLFLDMLSLSRPKESNHQIIRKIQIMKATWVSQYFTIIRKTYENLPRSCPFPDWPMSSSSLPRLPPVWISRKRNFVNKYEIIVEVEQVCTADHSICVR